MQQLSAGRWPTIVARNWSHARSVLPKRGKLANRSLAGGSVVFWGVVPARRRSMGPFLSHDAPALESAWHAECGRLSKKARTWAEGGGVSATCCGTHGRHMGGSGYDFAWMPPDGQVPGVVPDGGHRSVGRPTAGESVNIRLCGANGKWPLEEGLPAFLDAGGHISGGLGEVLDSL